VLRPGAARPEAAATNPGPPARSGSPREQHNRGIDRSPRAFCVGV
jgi:hypothetical protein